MEEHDYPEDFDYLCEQLDGLEKALLEAAHGDESSLSYSAAEHVHHAARAIRGLLAAGRETGRQLSEALARLEASAK